MESLSLARDTECGEDTLLAESRRRSRIRSLLAFALIIVLIPSTVVLVVVIVNASDASGSPPNAPPTPSQPPRSHKKCTVLPYASAPTRKDVKVIPAVALSDWAACTGTRAELDVALDPGHTQFFVEEHLCRIFSVPIDHSAGVERGTINLTVSRGAKKVGPGQMWVLQGGPGAPSHPLLDYMHVPTLTSYAMDHRGTGWSTALDCPQKRRSLSGNLPWGNAWMKWVGLGNVSIDLLSECLEEAAKVVGAPKHFTASNAARDLAAVIMTLQKEDGVGVVGIHGLSYGTLWARRFLALQGMEFPKLVTRVGLDGVVSADYDFGQYSLSSEFAGRTLLRDYCDSMCRSKLNLADKNDANAWLSNTIFEIDKAVTSDAMAAKLGCGTYLWARFAKDAQRSGWTANASIKEALGVFAYVEATKGYPQMVEFVAMVQRLYQCFQQSAIATPSRSGLPNDFEGVSLLIDKFATSAEEYFFAAPPAFSALLHHIVLFGDMWVGPPELSAWGGPREGLGDCTLKAWRKFFDRQIFWAPDFVSLTMRYQGIFEKFGYREASLLAQSYGRPDESVSVFLSNGDLDPQTPRQSARTTYEALPYCKVYEELHTGKHCVSRDYRVEPGYKAFFDGSKLDLPGTNSPCANGSTEPSSIGMNFALEEFTTRNTVQTVDWYSSAWHFSPCDPRGESSIQANCTLGILKGCEGGCFTRCKAYLQTMGDSMATCRCAARASDCARLGGCRQDAVELCQNLTRGSDCSVFRWCGGMDAA